jgi:hypothetical protein
MVVGEEVVEGNRKRVKQEKCSWGNIKERLVNGNRL